LLRVPAWGNFASSFKIFMFMDSLRNRVLLIGRLGADPETKTLAGGDKVTRFSIATTDSYKNDKGERISETQWHSLVARGKTAEIAGKYLEKGKEVAIEGKLVTRHYTDKEGMKHHITEVVVCDMVLIGSRLAED
jgi:single-strand DNA-binding protein